MDHCSWATLVDCGMVLYILYKALMHTKLFVRRRPVIIFRCFRRNDATIVHHLRHTFCIVSTLFFVTANFDPWIHIIQLYIYIYIYIYIYKVRFMVIFSWLYSYLINRRHSYRWVAAVSWLKYLILAIDSWRSSAQHQVKDELISDVFLWTPLQGRANVGRTYLQQLSTDTMDERDKWWQRVRKIRASCVTRWWWYIKLVINVGVILETIFFNVTLLCVTGMERQSKAFCWSC